VRSFNEKPVGGELWINGGFFILSPGVFDYIEDASTVFEREPLEALARDRELVAFRHEDFWYSMDTMRDKKHLEELWARGAAPWKTW
jgi:glucose-1-phosphate cytidylyltransferase